LKALLDNLKPNELLPPAFEKCGIYPINPEKVLSRLPTELASQEIASNVDESLLKTLEVRRYGDGKKKARAGLGKKIPAGQSYSARRSSSSDSTGTGSDSDLEEQLGRESSGEEIEEVASKVKHSEKKRSRKKETSDSSKEESDEDWSSKGKGKSIAKGKQPAKVSRSNRSQIEDNSDSSMDSEEEQTSKVKSSGKGKELAKERGSKRSRMEDNGDSSEEELPDLSSRSNRDPEASSSWNSGELVVALYEGSFFVAEILGNQEHMPKNYLRLSYSSIRGQNVFCWPDRKDIMATLREDIILKSVKVEPLNSRGHFGLTKADFNKVKNIMVLVHLYITSFFISFYIFCKITGTGTVMVLVLVPVPWVPVPVPVSVKPVWYRYRYRYWSKELVEMDHNNFQNKHNQ